MKRILLALICVSSLNVLAADETSSLSSLGLDRSSLDKGNSMEASLTYMSINNGTPFATVGMMHEWDNGFGVGARAYLPMQYTAPADAYMLQLAARFLLLNEVNQVFVDGTLTHGFFNAQGSTFGFNMVGVEFGYSRKLAGNFTVGGILGVDYSGDQISHNTFSGGSTFYNKIGVTGGYVF